MPSSCYPGYFWDIFSLFGSIFNSFTNFLDFQDPNSEIECHVSPPEPKGHFEDANVLGMMALRKLELSVVMDWKKDRFKLIKQ